MHHNRRIPTTTTTGRGWCQPWAATPRGRRLGSWYRRPFRRVRRSTAAAPNHPRLPSAHGTLLPAGGCSPFWRIRGGDRPSSEGHRRLWTRWRATAVNSPNGPRSPAPATTLVGQDALSAVFCDGATFNISLTFLNHAKRERAREHAQCKTTRADVVHRSTSLPVPPRCR